MTEQAKSPALPRWKSRQPVLEYDPGDIYDTTYRDNMLPLLRSIFKDAGLYGAHAPEMAFGRLYDTDNPGEYTPIVIVVDEKYMALRGTLNLLRITYRLGVTSIPIPGAEYGEEYIYISPGHSWEDADFYMSIQDEIESCKKKESEES